MEPDPGRDRLCTTYNVNSVNNLDSWREDDCWKIQFHGIKANQTCVRKIFFLCRALEEHNIECYAISRTRGIIKQFNQVSFFQMLDEISLESFIKKEKLKYHR